MNPSLTKALSELKAVSPTASKIIDQHFSGYTSLSAEVPDDAKELRELVTKLLETVEYQSRELDKLSDKLRIPEKDLSEDTAKFKESLKPFDVGYLVLVYDRYFFANSVKKEPTRKALATALIEYASEKKKKPADIWIALVNNNGSLEG